MTIAMPELPNRPLKVRVPPPGWGHRLLAGFGLLVLAGLAVASLIFVAPPLLTDWQVRDAARPALAGQIDSGSCSSKLFVNVCDVVLSAGKNPNVVVRDVHYVFVDAHAGDYSVAVLADPARPALLTTDLGLDKLVNRTITIGLFWLAIAAGTVAAVRTLLQRRRERAEMAGWTNMRLVPLRLTAFSRARGASSWTVVPLEGGKARIWSAPGKASPFMLGSDVVLGATGGTDGRVTVPLDQDLEWIDLTDAERAALMTKLHAEFGEHLPA
ncbi:hypothetical protein [Roseomonas haemaphysalidis]|uniref:DUF3592 domain-containing protein n=1 Tax=Roseomonas haemaphysalidis TaxID=2768162 RepID=A0ABS3KJ35_9PROT|nr:hypothetical protein [Roseomonas haemaphysalidis]MBO1077483.1 hypothetical protein [Roseomonas haemaphysalidis]